MGHGDQLPVAISGRDLGNEDRETIWNIELRTEGFIVDSTRFFS
jgi:hypothetical protein